MPAASISTQCARGTDFIEIHAMIVFADEHPSFTREQGIAPAPETALLAAVHPACVRRAAALIRLLERPLREQARIRIDHDARDVTVRVQRLSHRPARRHLKCVDGL